MYTWLLNLYIWVIEVVFVVSPFFIFYLHKRNNKSINKYRIIIISFFVFVIFMLLVLMLREYHLNIIKNVCFDYTGYEYKSANIPSGCHMFDRDKYMGVGWIFTAVFLTAYNFIYHVILYFVWYIVKKFKAKGG